MENFKCFYFAVLGLCLKQSWPFLFILKIANLNVIDTINKIIVPINCPISVQKAVGKKIENRVLINLEMSIIDVLIDAEYLS